MVFGSGGIGKQGWCHGIDGLTIHVEFPLLHFESCTLIRISTRDSMSQVTGPLGLRGAEITLNDGKIPSGCNAIRQ